jgi:pimeloyl-ACP methyl ester carboxylesterase
MKRLIVLSDLWGKRKSDWIQHYRAPLAKHFEVVFYDSCELAELDLQDYSEENLHRQFVNGGIDRGVSALIKNEKDTVHVLGFSVGGLIAWKAALAGLKVEKFTALSSTRLRYEEHVPSCPIDLYFAENDPYKPSSDWFEKMNLSIRFAVNEEHYFYTKSTVAADVINKMIDQF